MNACRYPLIHRILHWLIAITALGMLGLGFMFWYYGSYDGLKEAFGGATTNQIYLYHKSFGVVVLALMVLRLIVKLTTAKPEYQRPLTAFERAGSGTVHGLFYVLLIAMPVFGWAYTAAGGFPVEFFGWKLPGIIGKDVELSKTLFQIHRWTGRVIAVLIVLHFAAAMKHTFIDRDRLLVRMGFF